MKTDEGVSPSQRSRARTMRGAPTDAELRFWRLLRDRRLYGIKFRRQVPLGPYIVDFLCVGAKLIVEADGSQHAESLRDNISVTLIWRAKAGRCFASGTTRCFRIVRACLRQSWRMQADPHPALRATFSLREKGTVAHRLVPKTKGLAKRYRRSPSPPGRRWTRHRASGKDARRSDGLSRDRMRVTQTEP
jgi:hypothetical protein